MSRGSCLYHCQPPLGQGGAAEERQAGQAWGGGHTAAAHTTLKGHLQFSKRAVTQSQEYARKEGELVELNPGAATLLPLVLHNPEMSRLSRFCGVIAYSEAQLEMHFQGP